MTAVAEHTPADYARLLWRKWDRTWHWFEIPNNENIYYVRERVAILRYLPVGFWLISPLALVGLALGMSRFRLAWPLYAVVALASATLVAFLVVARQRAPLYAALLPFAALTISEIGRHCRDRRFARAIGLLAAVAAVSAWTGRPKSADEYTIRTADWLLPFSLRDEGLADAAIQRNDWAAASAAYADFFSRDAPSPDQVALSDDPTLAPTMATMHLIRADFERRAGRAFDADVSEAETLLHLSTVRGSASSRDGRDQMRQAYWRLGDLYREANRPDRALDVYRALCNLSPDDTAARRRYAGALLRAERVPDAIEQYQQIVATSAEDKDAWSGLGIALADSRRFDEAVAAFREASRLDPRSGHAHYNLARALAATGALGDALAEAERAVALDPEDPALRSLVAELQRSGAKRLR